MQSRIAGGKAPRQTRFPGKARRKAVRRRPGIAKHPEPSTRNSWRSAMLLPGLEPRVSMDKLFFVYMLANCRRGVLYVGVTNDLARRMTAHKQKLAPGFTKNYGVCHLVYYEEYNSI